MKDGVDKFLPLSSATLHILLALAGDDLHGYAIMQEIARHSEGQYKLGPGTLYDNLQKLIHRKWVQELGHRPADDDPRRRYYRLTSLGCGVLAAETARPGRRGPRGSLASSSPQATEVVMLTSLYRRVIRLHPQAFREKFGDEMLSIFDGAKGTPSAIALLLDAVVSLTRQWGLRSDVWRGLDPSPAQPAPDGVPTFSSLAPFRPRSAAVLEGLLLSLTLFCLTCFAIRYSWIHVLHVRIPEVQFERPTWRPENRSAPTNVSLEETLTTVRQQSPPKVVPSDAPSAASNPTLALPTYSTPAKAKARKRASPASRDTAPVESKDATNSSGEGFASPTETPLPLQTFEGTYMVESPRKMTIVITGEGERLMTTMDEKHRFGLIEVSQTKFLVRGIANCWIEFVPNRDPNDNGVIRQLKLSCNGEQLIARRQ